MKEKDRESLEICEEKHLVSNTQTLPVLIRPLEYDDESPICSWVQTSKDLTMISGDTADCLNPEILQRWCADSIVPIVLQCWNKPFAFCTLSTKEYNLPNEYVEVCHFVTAPNQRRKYFATVLLNYLRLITAQYGYKKMVGRIERDNSPALKFAEYVRWSEIKNRSNIFDPKFRWYYYGLKK